MRRDKYLSKINAKINLLPTNTIQLTLETTEQKNFIRYCFHNKLFEIANAFPSISTWSPFELNQFRQELIDAKNEAGLIQLFKVIPDLGHES